MAKRTLKKIIKGQRGQALPIVLILLAIGGLLIIPTLNYASTSLKGHQVVESNTLEFYAADSGVEDALYWLIKGRQTEGPWEDWDEAGGVGERQIYNINDRSVNVTVERMDEMDANFYKIISTATSIDGSTTILSIAWAIPFFGDGTEFNNQNTPPPGDVHINGDATLNGNIEITGNLTASGSITAINNAKITGNVNIDGDLALNNNSEITGTVCCGGNITLGNGCIITGDIRVGDGSTITLDEPAQIVGNIWADGDLSIYIRTNGDIGCEGNPDVGHIYAAGDINIYLAQSNAIIWGTVTADGSIQLEGGGEIKGGICEGTGCEVPFEAPLCSDLPESPTKTQTFEIAHS